MNIVDSKISGMIKQYHIYIYNMMNMKESRFFVPSPFILKLHCYVHMKVAHFLNVLSSTHLAVTAPGK
jgi:hypothetical protein